MKKLSFIVLAIVMSSILLSSSAYSDMLKEGSGKYRSGRSAELNILKLDKGRFQMNFDETGVVVDAREIGSSHTNRLL